MPKPEKGRPPLLQPPRGTRDFYPEDMRLREWLFGHFRTVARRFGFEEVDAPVVESLEICERKAGEDISEQIYLLRSKTGKEDLVLRPEFTPSLARMVFARRGRLRLPLRWFALPQCWRYERPGLGRRREHYQWNMDIWGDPDVTAEAELLAAAFAALDGFGLQPGAVQMRLNHRGLLDELLRERFLQGRPEAFKPLCIAIDKIEKIGRDAVEALLCDPAGPVRLAQPDAREVTSYLELRGIEEVARVAAPDSAAIAELRRLWELLDCYGLAERVDFDGSVVRGLAYYTGVVFEAGDAAGRFRAICGGGRYDHMMRDLDAGGTGLPAAGFGFGDAVIVELLRASKLLPEAKRQLDAVVYPMGDSERPAATRLATALRGRGLAVELLLGTVRAKRAFADADRAGAGRVYMIGSDELARGAVRVKELATGEEHEEPLPA